jgi:hypothetical protein
MHVGIIANSEIIMGREFETDCAVYRTDDSQQQRDRHSKQKQNNSFSHINTDSGF